MRDMPGKQLDEACNSFNETYGDEVLYAAWAEPPDIGHSEDVCAAPAGPSIDDQVEVFLARMYACQA